MKVYRCFSNPLKQYLMNNGMPYILIAKDCVTNKTFWLFENNTSLNLLLNTWRQNNPNKS